MFALGVAKGLVVLGLLLLMRTGLVSFGQGLYYGLGAYAAALANFAGWTDAAVLMLAGCAPGGVVAAVLGLLLARYRLIFFDVDARFLDDSVRTAGQKRCTRQHRWL